MKTKFRLTICLSFILLAASVNAAGQTNFDTFWNNFKAAIAKADKNTVAAMTKFPLSMPYGIKSVKTKTEFIKRYNEIFKGDADAVKCFPNAELIKQDKRNYAAYCTFKDAPENSDDKPLKYIFELTKSGWKFTGFDNINE